MTELTNAGKMARNAGTDPEVFRDALRAADFPWYKPGDDWTVVVDSPEYQAMRTVLVISLLRQKKGKDANRT